MSLRDGEIKLLKQVILFIDDHLSASDFLRQTIRREHANWKVDQK